MTTISFSGLDLSFLKNDPMPKREKKVIARAKPKRSDLPCPYVVPDITPFQNVATREGGEITSRSQLREFERRHNLRQVGDDIKPGEIARENERKKRELEDLAKGVDHGWTD